VVIEQSGEFLFVFILFFSHCRDIFGMFGTKRTDTIGAEADAGERLGQDALSAYFRLCNPVIHYDRPLQALAV
jgi:hypothetical protein